MDNSSIFSKTGKGSLEITKKTIKLSSEERQALILVDGKTSYIELQQKLGRVPVAKLHLVFEKLLSLELIREFVAKSDPVAAPVPSGAISVRELGGGSDLDFTAIAPPAAASDLEERRKAAAAAEEEAKQVREAILRKEQERKSADEAARRAAQEQAQRKAEEEARIKAEAERLVREQREREEQERLAREQREREEAARRAAEEQARRKAEEDARIKAEAERLAREQREREEQERLAREQREREEAARRAAEEEARRKAEEEARIKAEAERLAREQREREEQERLAREQREREEAARRAAEEEARRKAEEEARIKAEAERLAREQREREERERLAREQREREEAARRAAEEQARRKAEEEARLKAEAERLAAEAEAKRRAEEEARRKADAERHAQEERELEARYREEREKLERNRVAREREEKERAEREAAAIAASIAATTAAQLAAASTPSLMQGSETTSSLDFNASNTNAAPSLPSTPPEPSAPSELDLDFSPESPEQRRKAEVDQLLASPDTSPVAGATPLTAGGPDTFADTGTSIDGVEDGLTSTNKQQEIASRKEIEREAKERAKAEARAKKEAEREAKRIAKSYKVKSRRSMPSAGVIVAGVVAVGIVGGVAYLFALPIDKPAIERALSERFGEPTTVGTAKFSPFPPELTLTGISIGPLKFGGVIARPDPTSLLSDNKVWKSVEVTGVTLDPTSTRALLALATRSIPRSAVSRTELQRIRISGADFTGLPLPLPKLNADAILTASGGVKQVTLSTADDKARVLLSPDEKGWLIEIDSKGVTWPLGPKIAWEGIRAKGVASAAGIKFDDYAITHFGGSSRGAGQLNWNNGWKFSGNLDAGGLEAETIAQGIFGAAPVSGTIEGKLSITMSSASLPTLFDAPQIEGAINVNKATVKNLDLARTAQTGVTTTGPTRFSDFSATLDVSGGKTQLKDIKGVSGLLTVSGQAEVLPNRNLGGTLNIELGVGGSRAKATLKVSGTMAEPGARKVTLSSVNAPAPNIGGPASAPRTLGSRATALCSSLWRPSQYADVRDLR